MPALGSALSVLVLLAGGAAMAEPLPEPGTPWDYQIGGAFPPAVEVGVVARDRRAAPYSGGYNLCYVNAFQTQPDERRFWRRKGRWSLVLKDRGEPVVDGAWGEFLLDTRGPARRQRLAHIVGRWINRCSRDGFDAVELDNLDSWNRSRGLIERRHNRRLARLLTRRVHAAGLAAAQKNWAELAGSGRGPRLGFDLAVAEQCGQFRECGRYAAAYDDRVLVVEYTRPGFRRACARWSGRLSIVRRDIDVTRRGINRRC